MTPRTKWTIAGTAVLALALLAWAFAPRPVAVEVAEAGEAPFEVTVDEDGRTRLTDRFVVSAPLAGRLARIAWREGDRVQAGQALGVLAPLPSSLLDERARREQSARVQAAQAQLGRAEAGVGRAGVALEQARVSLRRTEQLSQSGFVAPTQLDAQRLALRGAERELDAAVQERQVAVHGLALARAAAEALQGPPAGRPRELVLRSPVDGQVLRVLQTSETSVPSGAPLLEIGDLARLEVVVPLLSTDALKVGAGTPVRVERWGGPQTLDGRVRLVEPAAFTKVSALGVEEQRVNVVVDITTPRPVWTALGDGFRVGVRVVVQSAGRALCVPAGAVFPLPGGGLDSGAAAFVVEGGRVRQVKLELAGRNSSQAWVSSGLSAGDRVVVYPPRELRDGVRVKERRV